jgi:LDH2 family malate/lactate/ureidoglycolate dehydrogenase
MTTRLDPDTLVTFGADVLPAVGLPEPDARLVAESLITADLWGHPSHGMLRLDWYVAGLWSGRDAPGHRDVPDEHEDPRPRPLPGRPCSFRRPSTNPG